MLNKFKIILASSSPRRIEMFHKNGFDPVILPADVEETLPMYISAKDAVLFLALKKGLFVEELLSGTTSVETDSDKTLIVSADTVVFLDTILGKPKNQEDAFQMLRKMRNRTHYVATGVSLILAGAKRKRVFYQITEVAFKDYTDQEIEDYIATGEPMDKAGSYAIQGGWASHIDHYVGDYNNIVGFPWDRFMAELPLLIGDTM